MLRELVGPQLGQSLVSVSPETKVDAVSKLMADRDVGCVLVVDAKNVIHGIVTDRDIVLRCVARNINVHECPVSQVATPAPKTVREDAGVFDVIRTMEKAGVRRIPVVDAKNHPIGIFSFGDLLAILGKEFYAVTRHTTAAGRFDQILGEKGAGKAAA